MFMKKQIDLEPSSARSENQMFMKQHKNNNETQDRSGNQMNEPTQSFY